MFIERKINCISLHIHMYITIYIYICSDEFEGFLLTLVHVSVLYITVCSVEGFFIHSSCCIINISKQFLPNGIDSIFLSKLNIRFMKQGVILASFFAS